MYKYVSLGMILWRLVDAAHRLDFREYLQQKTTFMKQVQPSHRISPSQNLQ
jgi:hypothetical protein